MITIACKKYFLVKHCRKRVGGFTLIELLVVIAIIALLMSILMPSLRMAREQARTVVCGSQLHQSGLTILLYADDNDGYMPLNTLWSQYEPYMLHKAPNRFDNLGYLYQLGYIANPKFFYCPSESNSAHKFNSGTDNLWWEYPAAPPTNPEYITKSSYYYYNRIPDVFWNGKLRKDSQDSGIANGYRQYRRKLMAVKNKAIVSDNIYVVNNFPHYIRRGFNVLYADSSVNFWMDKKGYYKAVSESRITLSKNQVYDVFNMFDKSR